MIDNKTEHLKNLIDNNNTISFDIFDTLLFRNIHKPVDIFKILAVYAEAEYNIKDFVSLRIQSETDARAKVKNGECNFDDIYSVISEKCGFNTDKIKEKELELEYEFITANPFMKEIYEYALSKKKTVILISDMYLTQDFICKLLSKCGYSGYKIFVSNTFRCNKGSGQLYETVCSSLKLNKDSWLHIGDNPFSDYSQAKEFGISAFNYKNVSEYEPQDPNTIGESIIAGVKNNLLYNGLPLDYFEEFGIKYVFPIYFGFTHWLYELTKNDRNIFFLARDGYAIKKLYDKLCKKFNNPIFTQYVYCSRQSVQMPTMAFEEKMDDAIKFLTNRQEVTDNDITLREMLNIVQIDSSSVSDNLVRMFGFKGLDDIINSKNHHSAQKLIAMFSKQIRENLLKKHKNCLKYLDQIGMNRFSDINIMDIGWSGHIQNSLEKLLGRSIQGFYFGTTATPEFSNFCNMFGWIFDNDNPTETKQEIYENVMMYELLFSAPHGSCSGYEERDGKIVPILNNNISFNKTIEAFQSSAIEACESLLKYYDHIDYLRPEFCTKAYRNFIKAKETQDLRYFASITNDVSIGNDKMYPYVACITKEDVDEGIFAVVSKRQKSIWRGAYIFSDDIDDNTKAFTEYYLEHSSLEEYMKFDLSYSKIYFNSGEGFNEENSIIIKNTKIGDHYSFKLEIPLKAKEIRIDPVENHKISIWNTKIKINGIPYTPAIPHLNKPIFSKKGIIDTTDPNIIVVPLNKEIKSIEFSSGMEIIE